jgi:hypothetical protein
MLYYNIIYYSLSRGKGRCPARASSRGRVSTLQTSRFTANRCYSPRIENHTDYMTFLFFHRLQRQDRKPVQTAVRTRRTRT